MLLQKLSVANFLLQVHGWKEVQRDVAVLIYELGNIHLSTEEKSVGKRGRKQSYIFYILLKDDFWNSPIHVLV